MRISDWSSDVCSSDLRCTALPTTAWYSPLMTKTGTSTILNKSHWNLSKQDRMRTFPCYWPTMRTLLPVWITIPSPALEAAAFFHAPKRSEERRVGKAWVGTCSLGWEQYH